MQVEKHTVTHADELIEAQVRQCNEFMEVESLEKEVDGGEEEEVKGNF